MEVGSLIESMITNLPNFAGLALLAYVLFWMLRQFLERQAQQIEDYREQRREAVATEKWLVESLMACWRETQGRETDSERIS